MHTYTSVHTVDHSKTIRPSILNSINFLNLLAIHPVDHSRVILRLPDESGSDYINASYIHVRIIRSHYILIQTTQYVIVIVESCHYSKHIKFAFYLIYCRGMKWPTITLLLKVGIV